MKILFGAVIYKGVEKYLDEFIESIVNQSFNKFDTLIVNDGLKDVKYINKINYEINNCTILELSNYNLNPSQIRLEIIKYSIKEGYDLLIFADSDDTFSNNRIESIKNSYSNKIAFYYNDLIIKESKVDFFSGKLPKAVKNKNLLDDYNFIGMSNSAININKIKNIVCKINNLKECIAFDWYFYTLLIKSGFEGLKVENTNTYYRIYEENIAGFTNKLNYKNLINGIKVKKFQYKSLSKLEPLFLEKYNKFIKLEYILKNDETIMLNYINYINDKYKNSVFWWENIKLIDEFIM